VAWMVACSAITATLTTLLMGTLSDRARWRIGRRKPFIFIGYILWGISTIIFPTTAYIKTTSLAVVMVVIADSVMTFFGSTANDAAFSAWTADIATSKQRGRVEGVLNMAVFIAQIVAMAAAGILIEAVGYFTFFYVLGGIVILSGLVGGWLLQDTPIPAEKPTRSFWAEFVDLFQWETVRKNHLLFLLLLNIMIANIGSQVAMPYLIVYLNNYIGMSKGDFSIVGGAVMLGSAILAIPFGLLADRWDRRKMIMLCTLVGAIGGIIFSLLETLFPIALAGLVWQAFGMAAGVAAVAWLKDLLPEESRGRFLGVRMIFWIAIPMVLGPAIGSALIQSNGIPTVVNGEAGFIPTPIIFQVGSAITLLALIPLFIMRGKDKAATPPQP
jgi:MFS family permease